MANTDFSRGSSQQTDEFIPFSSPSPTFQAGVSPIASYASPPKCKSKRLLGSFQCKTVFSSSTALSATADDSPQLHHAPSLKSTRKPPPNPRTNKSQAPSEAFQAWLKAKEDAILFSKRRKQAAIEEEKRTLARRDKMNKEAMQMWRDQHEARLREKKANEKNLQRLERIHRREEALRSVEHDRLCRQKYQQWLREKLKTQKPMSASQYMRRLSPKLGGGTGSQDMTSSPLHKVSASVTTSPMNRKTLSLATFKVSIEPPTYQQYSDSEESF